MKKKIPLLRLKYSKREKKFISLGIEEILNSGFLTMAKKVKQFEEIFAKFNGTKALCLLNLTTTRNFYQLCLSNSAPDKFLNDKNILVCK